MFLLFEHKFTATRQLRGGREKVREREREGEKTNGSKD